MTGSNHNNSASFGVKHVAVLGLTLAIGIGIGWLTAPRTENTQASRGDQGTKQTVAGKNGGASMNDSGSLPRRHRSKKSSLSRPGDGTITVPAEALGALANARKMPRFDGDRLFSQDDPVVKSLGITENEKLHLEEFWRSALGRIHQEETAQAKVQHNADGSVSIRVPPLTDLRVSVLKKFSENVKRELDPNRGTAFLSAIGSGSLLADSGQEVEYKVTTTSNGQNGWNYQIEKRSGDNKEIWMGDTFPAEYRHLAAAAGIDLPPAAAGAAGR